MVRLSPSPSCSASANRKGTHEYSRSPCGRNHVAPNSSAALHSQADSRIRRRCLTGRSQLHDLARARLIVIQAFTQQNPQMTISQLSVRTASLAPLFAAVSIRLPSSASPVPRTAPVTPCARACSRSRKPTQPQTHSPHPRSPSSSACRCSSRESFSRCHHSMATDYRTFAALTL